MGKIQQLPEEIAIKIAAGEVVERPASVVKELVENSLDAGATEIAILLEEGGKRLIEVVDNGSGMDRSDAVQAFLRHGTSKIREVNDLLHVATLGFRGEALAAIAASGEVELVTTLHDNPEGTRVFASSGAVSQPKPHAPLPGTRIRVTDLFAHLPARQKFLKSDATEWKACLDSIVKQTLSHPEVGFTLEHNNRVIFNLSPDQTIKERVAEVWQIEPEQLIEVTATTPHLSLSGVIAKPEIVHERRGQQFLSVNGHPVNDKAIVKSIRNAYGTLLPPTLHPTYALNLVLHPGMVDVNIHPRKDEVRFFNPQEVFRFVLVAVSQALETANATFTSLTPLNRESQRQKVSELPKSIATGNPSAALLHDQEMEYQPRRVNASFRATFSTPSFPPAIPQATTQSVPLAMSVLTLGNCFLISQHEEALLLIDQHAAHERILYNQLVDQDKTKTIITQGILLPAVLELSTQERATFEEHRSLLESLGFGFEGEEQMHLIQVPQLTKRIEPSQFFYAVLRGIHEERDFSELESFKHRVFATMACKAAVKAGDTLSEAEKQQLIHDLLALPERFTCPHGRPSHILISTGELEKLFKRTGF